MIAMALACDPAIVIGDEPTTALDVMVQAQILQLLEQLRRDLGLSLMLITHDLSVIAETCDRVMVMYAGKVAEEGPVARVFTRAAPPVHAEAAVVVPEHPRRPPDARRHPGLAAGPAQPAARVPVRAALRVRDGRLPRGRPARGHVRRRRPGGLPPVPDARTAPRPASAPRAPTSATPGPGDERRPSSPGHEGHDHRARHRPHEATRGHAAARAPPRSTPRPTTRACPHRAPGARARSRRPGLRRRGRRPGAAPARGARGPLPDPRRAPRHAPRRPQRRRPRGRRDRPHDPQGRDPGARRRVRLGQDDDRAASSSSSRGRPPAGSASTARTSRRCGGPPRCATYRRRVQLIFQDPYETLNPKHTIGEFVEEPLIVNEHRRTRASASRASSRRSRPRACGPAADFASRYPARAVRRPAPAGR